MEFCKDSGLCEVLQKYNVNENTFKESFLKKFLFETTFLFLPKRILEIYIALSFLAFVTRTRNIPFCEHNLDGKRLLQILKITLNNDILIIPNFTYEWFWKKDMLETEITYHDKILKLRDIVLDNELFVHNFHNILDIFIGRLPGIFKFKLGLSRKRNKVRFGHLLTKLITRNTIYTHAN